MEPITALLDAARQHHEAGRLDLAEQCYANVLETEPNLTSAVFDRGTILKSLGRNAEALDHFRRTLDLDPSHVGACLQLGQSVFAKDVDAGLRFFRRAHDAAPSHAGARSCLTLGYAALGALHSSREEWAPMFDAYRHALDIDPTHPGTNFDLAVQLLRHGCFDEGWRQYEWRWKWKGFPDRPREFSQPLWQGEPIEGARILLHAEQGLGDTIQFARYAPMVAERGATVLLEVNHRLVRLMKSVPGVETVVARGDSLPAFDWQCPLMSLPLAFKTTIDTIPARIPYLAAPSGGPDLRSAAPGALTVGLVWAGSPAHLRDQQRSMTLDEFAPLTGIAGTRWYSLQKGPAEAALATPPPGLNLINLAPGIREFADDAAIMSSLDVVISVDTSVAHLAGALGKPVWILVPKPPDWRWLLDRDDSPWYPTARLFRQQTAGAWAPVVERVHQALRALVS